MIVDLVERTPRELETAPILIADRLSMRLGQAAALEDGSLALWPGEIHILLGEKGSGKSALLKLLSGDTLSLSGSIFVDGRPAPINSQAMAIRLGIVAVGSPTGTFRDMTVVEYLTGGVRGEAVPLTLWSDRRAILERTSQRLASIGLADVDPRQQVESLSPGQRRVLQIAKAVTPATRILLLDEPAPLTERADAVQVLSALLALKRRGIAILYATKQVEDARLIGDRATILRQGRSVASVVPSETPIEMLLSLMSGRQCQGGTGCSMPQQCVLAKVLLAKEEERKRIAFEIHDGIAQLVAGALQATRETASAVSTGRDGALAGLELTREILRETVDEVQRVLFDLRPADLDDCGLTGSLAQLVASLERTFRGKGQFQVLGEPVRLPRTTELTIYRVVQECLHNVSKHASASNVRVSIEFCPSEVRVVVSDDGQGFVKGQGRGQTSGLGLRGMEDRARQVDGVLAVQSVLGWGTEVRLVIPLVSHLVERRDVDLSRRYS